MPIHDMKGAVSFYLIIFIVCFVFLAVLSASSIIFNGIYKKQIYEKDKQLSIAHNNITTLSQKNIELNTSLQKLTSHYVILKSQNEDLASELNSSQLRNTKLDSKLTSALDDLKLSKADAIKAKGVTEELLIFKDIIAPYVVLEPTWVRSGVGTSAFNGNITIVFYENSQNHKCVDTSSSICYFIEKKHKRILCLEARKPDIFTYHHNQYLLNLLQLAGKHRW